MESFQACCPSRIHRCLGRAVLCWRCALERPPVLFLCSGGQYRDGNWGAFGNSSLARRKAGPIPAGRTALVRCNHDRRRNCLSGCMAVLAETLMSAFHPKQTLASAELMPPVSFHDAQELPRFLLQLLKGSRRNRVMLRNLLRASENVIQRSHEIGKGWFFFSEQK
jgi:hypothetical protein